MITPDHAYYYALRLNSRKAVADSLMNKIVNAKNKMPWSGITLASINRKAIDYARLEWARHYSEDTHNGFIESWDVLHRRFQARPSFFDLAIWQRIGTEDVLQGLALGRPSNGKTHLTLNWVERSFAPTYLRGGILLPVLACAEEYAKLLGSKRVLIKDPVDPHVYGRYGYSPYKLRRVPAVYLCKEL